MIDESADFFPLIRFRPPFFRPFYLFQIPRLEWTSTSLKTPPLQSLSKEFFLPFIPFGTSIFGRDPSPPFAALPWYLSNPPLKLTFGVIIESFFLALRYFPTILFAQFLFFLWMFLQLLYAGKRFVFPLSQFVSLEGFFFFNNRSSLSSR